MGCAYIYEDIKPRKGIVAVEVIEIGENLPEKCVVKHVLSNGKVLKEIYKKRLASGFLKSFPSYEREAEGTGVQTQRKLTS